jgi:hypothetical protein
LIGKDDFMGITKIKLEDLTPNKTQKFVQKLSQTESGTLVFEIIAKNMELLKRPEDLFKPIGNDEEKETVFHKLKQSYYSGLSKEHLMDMAENLSNSEKLKKKYLLTNWVDALKVHQESFSDTGNFKLEDLSYEEFEEIKELENMEKEAKKESDKKSNQFQKDLKIKIVFVDQMKNSNFQKGIRKIISPIVSDLNISTLGLFHTALLVGPWFIEWNDSALCIPRNCTSQAAFLTADIGEISTVESLESLRDEISNVIVHWNTNVGYSSIGKKKNEGNCQNFIESILSALNLKLEFSGALGKFIESIKKNGNSNLTFPVSLEMKQRFGIEKDSIEFISHSELDHFFRDLQEKDLAFELKFRDEYKLLKSFDRAFWLKYLKLEKELTKHRKALKFFENKKLESKKKAEMINSAKQEIEAIQKSETLRLCRPSIRIETEYEGDCEMDDCPFGDPTETKSFWV